MIKLTRNEVKEIVLKESSKLFDKQVKWRRHFHQHPELSYEEFKTTAFIKKICQQAGMKILPLKYPTGLMAEISGGKGKTAAVRTDIDALPITELTDLKFKSKNIGCMHACGHDMHIATVLGVAMTLNKLKKYLNGTVRFIFQPAEELPPGGARPMIENGAVKNVDMIFGLHVDPLLQVGKISTLDGPAMASVCDFDLIVVGRGGHAARPHDTADAIVIASEIISNLQHVVSRKVDPIDPVVITFGKIEGGTARNVICDKVVLRGTARTLSKKTSREVPKLIKKTAENIARAHGATIELNFIADYPVLVNSPATNKIVRENYEILFGKNKIEPTEQTLGGEDFACYLEKVEGAMFRLGVGNPKIKADKPWHSPYFVIDENGIKYGTAVVAASVIDFLNS